jgi:general stress protein YciG
MLYILYRQAGRQGGSHTDILYILYRQAGRQGGREAATQTERQAGRKGGSCTDR